LLGGMARHDDRLGVRRHFLQALEHLDAADARHAQVEDGGVELTLLEDLEGLAAVGTDGHLVPAPRQFALHQLAQVLLVVDEEDTKALALRRRCQGFPPYRSRSLLPRAEAAGARGTCCPGRRPGWRPRSLPRAG